MYDRGFGTYNETARSFYNVNPVFNPEDNGRAAPQFQTQHVPIFNPALTQEHMHSQAAMSREYLQTGGIVNLATRGMHAENYSLLESQASAKSYSNIMSGLGRVTSVAGAVGSLFAGPFAPLLMAGAYYGEEAFDKYKRYYEDYGTRMGNIAGLRSHFSNVGGGIVNPYTGVMSGLQASNLANGFSSAAQQAGFSEQDMYSIHTMASQSGLMDGFNGSVSSVTARVSSLAKVTRSIMKLGEGIDQHTAMEMQRLTESMEIDLGKFQNLDIAAKVVSAARLTKKSIQATTAMIDSAASASSQAGLGGQMGAESALFMSRYAAPQFSNLSAAQQRAVGGSADAYVQNLVSAQVNYASRNASTLALGSYYIDPTTGEFKVDTNEVAAMAHRGFDPREEYKRGMRILDKDARQRLKDAGISQSFVTNALQSNIGTLGKQAINFIDNDLQSAMSINEIVRTAADNGMSFEQAATSLGYSAQEASSLKIFGENYGKGSKFAREEDRRAYIQELRTRNASSAFISNSQRRNTAERDAERAAANSDAARDAFRADRAREEELGIYGGRRRSYTDSEITGALFGEYDVISGRGGLVGGSAREGYQFGVYTGRREKDIGRGFFGTIFNGGAQGSGFGFTASVADRAMGKEVLSKIYRDDFFGKGTSVTSEGIFGQDNSIMNALAQGSTFATDDFSRFASGRDAVPAALAEIFGKQDSLESYLSLVKNKQARYQLARLARKDSFDKEDASTLSTALASVAVVEIAEFSDLGRSLRTQNRRDSLLANATEEDSVKINRAAEALAEIANQNSSTNSDFVPRNNEENAIQTSKRKMAQAIYNKNRAAFSNVEEVEKLLPQILATAYDYTNTNARTLIDKISEVAETARGMTGAAAYMEDGSSTVYSSITEDTSGNEISRVTMSGAQFLLGKKDIGEDKDIIAASFKDKAVELANTIREVSASDESLSSPGAAQKLVSEISYKFLKYFKKHGSTDDSPEVTFKKFLRENRSLEAKYNKLGKSTKDSLRAFIMQQSSYGDLVEGVASESIKEEHYTRLIERAAVTGAKNISKDAVRDFLEGSTVADDLFGEGEGRAERALSIFNRLSKGAIFDKADLSKLKREGGGVDVGNVLAALGFDSSTMHEESYEQVRSLASQTFGGGNFGKENQLKFAKQLQTMIANGKVRNIDGVGGDKSNASAVQEAVNSMLLLQSATAKLLTALATPGEEGKAKLTEVASMLQTLQSPKGK